MPEGPLHHHTGLVERLVEALLGEREGEVAREGDRNMVARAGFVVSRIPINRPTAAVGVGWESVQLPADLRPLPEVDVVVSPTLQPVQVLDQPVGGDDGLELEPVAFVVAAVQLFLEQAGPAGVPVRGMCLRVRAAKAGSGRTGGDA